MRVYIDGLEVTDCVSFGIDTAKHKAEQLDEGSFVVAPITRKKPFEMGSVIFLGEEAYVLSGDSVSVCARGSVTGYRHEIRYANMAQSLKLYTMRGTDLHQPSINPHRRALTSVCTGGNESDDTIMESLEIRSNERIKEFRVFFRLPYASSENYETGSSRQILCDLKEANDWNAIIELWGTDYNGGDHFLKSWRRADFVKAPNQVGFMHIEPYSSAFEGYKKFFVKVFGPTVNDEGSFLRFANVVMFAETYNYTYKDAINECIKATYTRADEEPFVYFSEQDAVYNKVAPDFTFPQGTSLYDALKEIMESLDMKLDAYYYKGTTQIRGIPYGESGSHVSLEEKAHNSDLSDSNRAQSAVVSYQNATIEGASYAPAHGTATKPKSRKLGVPSPDSYHILTPEPINAIMRVWAYADTEVNYLQTNRTVTIRDFGWNIMLNVPANFPIDITDFVYEQDEQSLLPISSWQTEWKSPTQGNTFSWNKGQRDIYCGCINKTPVGTMYYAINNLMHGAVWRLFTDAVTDTFVSMQPLDVAFNVEYKPLMNGCLSVESNEEKAYGDMHGSMNVRQSTSLCETGKIGKNAYGLVSRVGWEDKTITLPFGANIPNNGDFVTIDNEIWMVTSTEKTAMPNGHGCSVSLTRNFNKLSLRTKVDREIRQTEISPNLALLSTIVSKTYIHIYKDAQTSHPFGNSVGTNLLLRLGRAMNGEVLSQFASGAKLTLEYASEDSKSVFLPLTEYSAGNAYCLEGGFETANNAGYKIETASGWVTSYTAKPIIYTDSNGEVKKFSASLYSSLGVIDDYSDVNPSEDPKATISECLANKHANEIMRLNYEAVVIGHDGYIVYPAMAKLLCASTGRTSWSDRSLKLVTRSDKPFTGFEGKISGGTVVSIACSVVSGQASYTFYKDNKPYWCLVTYDGTPVLACNDGSGTTATFYAKHTALRPKEGRRIVCKVTLGEHVKSIAFSNGRALTESGYVQLPSVCQYSVTCDEGYTPSSASGTITRNQSQSNYAELSISAS